MNKRIMIGVCNERISIEKVSPGFECGDKTEKLLLMYWITGLGRYELS